MSRQITKNESNISSRYTNKKSTAQVKSKRIDNYSEYLIQTLEPYAYDIGPVINEYNKDSSRKTMALKLERSASTKTQNRRSHQDMVVGIAVECGKKLGLNTGLIEIMARNHDVGHTFWGHGGERWLSQVKQKYGLGVYTHSALGPKELIYRYRIYDEIIDRISAINPELKEGELNRIKKSLWVIFDGINSHNGELSDVEIKPNFQKTAKDFYEEILRSHTEKGFDKGIMPATIEGSLIRMCDKAAYTPYDMLDGIYEGFIPKIKGEHAEILRELGITREEIASANLRRSYEKIARKVQVRFVKSLIENSSMDVIRMDIETARLMHRLRDVNNKEIINYQLLVEDQEVYPNVIDILMNHFADITLDTIGGKVKNVRNASLNDRVARKFMRRFGETKEGSFARFISSTTPEIYDFNETMIKAVEENEKKVGKLTDIEFERKMALEFGSEYLSTLNDDEFWNLAVSQGLITETKMQSLTRKYKDIGKEGLISERYISAEWKERADMQAAETALMTKQAKQRKESPGTIEDVGDER